MVSSLDTQSRSRLKQLLGNEDGIDTAAQNLCRLLVLPRIGIISPWSSKSTDIALRCGLDNVRRLERGVIWSIDIDESNITSDIEKNCIGPYMTL